MANSTKSSTSSKATSMADLMKSVKTPLVSLQKGEILKGKITKLTSSEILVDINAKTEAVVLEKDRRIMRNIISLLKLGDEVTVSVLNPESDFGYPVVSLRRFVDDVLWGALEERQKKHEPIDVVVKEVIRGGLLVDTDMGYSGFLPNSQLSSAVEVKETESGGSQSPVVGKKLRAYILELNRDTRKIIFSQRPVVGEEEFANAIKTIKNGQKISAIISSITSFGLFVSVPIGEGKNIDGLIHISEVSWEKTEDLNSVGNVGQAIEAVVIGVDRDAKRVDLSIKRLTSDPFEERVKSFVPDQKVVGTISQILSSGIVVDLGDEIEGFIRKEKIPPTVTYKAGEEINATVSQVDIKRRRIILVPVLLRKTVGYR